LDSIRDASSFFPEFFNTFAYIISTKKYNFEFASSFFGTGSLERVSPISTLTGNWKRTGPSRFDSTAYFLAFDPAGNAVAMLKTNQVFHLKGRNELVGAALVYSCNLEGENCVSVSPAPSKVTGRRIE
jgi:hypothetical protein